MSALTGLAEASGAELRVGEADLLAYSYDGALDRARPEGVVLPADAEQVRRAVEWCAGRAVPFTARGAGTNLCGGCVPLRGGVVLSLARMDRILAVDTGRGLALVEPGVVNLRLQKELEKTGRFYAPDPASYRVCTLGGNIAENAGGPRCLKYGQTTHHVRVLEAVMPDGSLERFSADDAGPELMSLLIGAEGTLGVVTKAWVRALPSPERVATALAAFKSLGDAMDCVAAVIAAGIVPRVLEAMDRMTVESIEAYHPAGYPAAEAVLLMEVEGPPERVSHELGQLERLCSARGAFGFRTAEDAAERDRLWEGRRSAYAALARLAPNVLVEDGVVPRSRLPEAARRIREIARDAGVRPALLFHAGDGNLHPNTIFDERDAEQTRRVKAAGFEMLKACVELGGSISGEHGIGADKRAAMAWLFSPEALAVMDRVKRAFDPGSLANPGKVLPTPQERSAAPASPPPRRPLTDAARSLVERVREKAARGEALAVLGAGTRAPKGVKARFPEVLTTRPLGRVRELDRANFVLTAEAGVGLAELREACRAEGVFAPVPPGPGTLGGLLATKAWGGIREHLLGVRVLLADGTVAEFGGPVVKNVAGYDIPRVLLGSWGALAVVLEATLKVHAAPPEVPDRPPAPRPPAWGRWALKLKEAFDPAGLLNPWALDPEAFRG